MRKISSAHVSFSVPESWVDHPPFGARRAGNDELPPRAVAVSYLARAPRRADEVLDVHRRGLLARRPEFEAVAEGSGGASNQGSCWAEYSYRDETGERVLERMTVLVAGPLVGELKVLFPMPVSAEERRMLREISESLVVDSGTGLTEARFEELVWRECPAGLLEEKIDARRYPTLGLVLPIAAGWEAKEGRCEVVLRRDRQSIVVRRIVGRATDVTAWLNSKVGVGGEKSEMKLLRWDRGNLAAGTELAAIVFVPAGERRTWNDRFTPRTMEMIVRNRHSWEWEAEGPAEEFEGIRDVANRIFHQSAELPPEEWRTPVAEEWSSLILEGDWSTEAPGVYASVDDGVRVVWLSKRPSRIPVGDFAPKSHAALRDGLDTGEILVDEHSTMNHRGLAGFHSLLAVRNTDGVETRLRSISLQTGNDLYVAMVQAKKSKGSLDDLFSAVVSSLRIPGMK